MPGVPGISERFPRDSTMLNKPSDITRLWWDGTHGALGVARHDGVTVDLDALPRIEGLPQHVRAIDYAPAMRVAMIRESAQAWREMTTAERVACTDFLNRIVDAVRGVVA